MADSVVFAPVQPGCQTPPLPTFASFYEPHISTRLDHKIESSKLSIPRVIHGVNSHSFRGPC